MQIRRWVGLLVDLQTAAWLSFRAAIIIGATHLCVSDADNDRFIKEPYKEPYKESYKEPLMKR